MVVFVSYDEIRKYVEEHYGQRIKLARVDQKELSVDYVKRIWIKDVSVDVKIRVDEVRPDGLKLSYKGGLAIDMIISGALNFFLEKFPELSQGIKKGENHSVDVNLSEIEKVKAVVENLSLCDIDVEVTGLNIRLALK